jgi:sulfite exporter TauE/SafE
MNYVSIFITGLFAGGLTCLVMQGGLLMSAFAQANETERHNNSGKSQAYASVIVFLLSRLIGYTLLGGLLGAIGSVVQFSLTVRAVLQMLISFFMIGTALNLLQIHPLFRYFAIQPPRFMTQIIKGQSKRANIATPIILGLLTVCIPCGATQAMMAYAVTTGSFIQGSLVLFLFILGTSPLFFIVGFVLHSFPKAVDGIFTKIVAIAIILVALYTAYGSISLSGFSFSSFNDAGAGVVQGGKMNDNSVTEATIYFTQSGYETIPSPIIFRGGSIVKLTLVNKGAGGCIQAFTIPRFGIQQIVTTGSQTAISLNIPAQSGKIPFMCSMGMYRGELYVQ